MCTDLKNEELDSPTRPAALHDSHARCRRRRRWTDRQSRSQHPPHRLPHVWPALAHHALLGPRPHDLREVTRELHFLSSQLGIDEDVINSEDTAARNAHPEGFAAYHIIASGLIRVLHKDVAVKDANFEEDVFGEYARNMSLARNPARSHRQGSARLHRRPSRSNGSV